MSPGSARRAAALIVVAAALLPAVGSAPAQTVPTPGAPRVPVCARAELRLRCPDLVMRKPYALHLERTPDGRRLLTATNAIVNVGDGPLELRGTKLNPTAMRARQVIRREAGATRPPLVLDGRGTIEYYDTGTRGSYWKYHRAARFELWRLDPRGNPTLLRRTGPKLNYCFRDLHAVRRLTDGRPYPRTPRARAYGACSQRLLEHDVTLGTSVGWADIYPYRYPQNWISVGGLRGCFLYVQRVDPDRRIEELREDNNAGATVVRLPWKGTGGRGCPAPTRIPEG